MIISTLLWVVGLIIKILAWILSGITWVIPEQVITAIAWVFDQLRVLDFIVPMQTVMLVLSSFITFLIFFYTFKLMMWSYHLVRHGSDHKTPKTHDTKKS